MSFEEEEEIEGGVCVCAWMWGLNGVGGFLHSQTLISRGFFMIVVLLIRPEKTHMCHVWVPSPLGCFCNQPYPNSYKTLFNNTPGSKNRAVPELTAGYSNTLFWKSIPQRGRKQQSHGNTDFLAILENIWESPSLVLLIQATPICLLVSGFHRGQSQSSLRHNTGEGCMKNLLI